MTGGVVGGSLLVGATGTASAARIADEIPEAEYVAADPYNYTSGNRSPSDVQYVVIHTLEGPYEANVRYFARANDRRVSSHFVVGKGPGEITQMVDLEDVAHTQGETAYNYNGVSIEMEGHASEDGHTDALYRNAAAVARAVCREWDVEVVHPAGIAPCDGSGEGIIGHDQVPEIHEGNCDRATDGKVDPGPYWDWDHFMQLVRSGSLETGEVVATNDLTNVRPAPDVHDDPIVTFGADTYGTVIDGPREADGYTFWKVEYNSATGWSIGRRLDARTPAFAEGDDVETAAQANVRKKPEIAENVVVTFPAGEAGTVAGLPKGADGYTFYPVEFGSATGWVPAEKLSAPRRFADGDAVYVTAEELAVRADPDLGGDLLKNQPKYADGTVVGGPRRADGITWWRVEYDDDYGYPREKTTGWSSGNYLQGGSPGRVDGLAVGDDVEVVGADSLSIRSGPGLEHNAYSSADRAESGTVITGPRYVDGILWWGVEYDHATGWSSGNFLERR